MGRRVLEFTKQYADPSPGIVAAAARLRDRLARADELAEQQLEGRTEIRVASGRKRELRRLMKLAHLNHLASVAEIASTEEPELLQKFVFPADATTYLAFRAAAGAIAAEAESRKELLMKHGLSEEVLTGLNVTLDQFETAVEQSSAGLLIQARATAELVEVADEVVQIVKAMNGIIRIRFGQQPELLAAWESATNIVATPRPEEKPASGGDVRPAA